MSSLQERMLQAYEYRESIRAPGEKISKAALARHCGIRAPSVSDWFNGETKALAGDSLLLAADYLKVRPEWLSSGKGAMVPANGEEHQESIGHSVSPSSMRPIWVVGRGAGGFMPARIWTDGGHPVGATDEFALLASSDEEAFLAEVVGQSMFPKYENRNFALVEPNAPVDIEDVVLVRLHGGETMIKRLLSRRNGSYTFGSYNDPEILMFNEVEVTWVYYCAHEVPRKRIKTRF